MQWKQQCNALEKIWCQKENENENYEWLYCKQRNNEYENI